MSKRWLQFLMMAILVQGCSQSKRSIPSIGSGDDTGDTGDTGGDSGGGGGDSGGGGGSAPTPATPPSTSCSSALIDSGQKGNAATVIRGNYSDVKIIPGTSSPATAYIDASAISIKFNFWDGTRFVTEPVSGDGTGAFVRLVFLSNKTPIVFWTLGTSLKVAIRSAPVTSTGTWTAGVIDTGTAPRAVEASVNPLDQVAVTFLTDTAAAGRAKFLYCDTGCSAPSNFQTMTTNPYMENTNLIAAQVGTGAGWCKASASLYYPAATYAVTGNIVRYAVCQNSNLANCLNGSNWTTQTVVASSSVSTKLLLDSSVTGDVAKVVALGASGIVPYKMGTTLCTASPTAFSAGSAMGTATSGSQWIAFLKDGAGKFHVAANESTTSVRYYNSSSTDPTAAWNAAGVIDTVTTPAATRGGADLDATYSTIYVSYGTNASPYDLKLGRVNDYTVASNSASFTRFTPDLTGDMQLSAATSQQKNVAVASTSAGRPAVAYVDFSVGAVANAKLKYAYRDGDSSAAWESVLVPNTVNPQFPGLAFDDANRPWISYFDASLNRFFLVTNSSTDGGGSWNQYEFPATPSGAPPALPAANNTAVGMHKSGGTVFPYMVVIDSNTTSKGVKYAKFNSQSLGWGSVVTIDGLTGGSAGAAHLSTDSDASGIIVVAYQELNIARARYSMSSNGTSFTTPLSISGVNQGQGVNIKLNPVSGKPVISYYDMANNAVYVAPCSNSPSACSLSGWVPAQAESAAGVSGLVAGNAQLLSTSMGFSTDGKVYVFYPRGQANGGNLAVSNNFSSSIFSSTPVAYGVNASLPGTPALNFGVAGWGVSVANNAAGSFSGAYVGPGNWLYSLSCGD